MFDIAQKLTWQKQIGTTPKGPLSPYDDASTAGNYCAQVAQPAGMWRAPTAAELQAFPALASDTQACFGTTEGVICKALPASGRTAPASAINMRCVH